MRRINILTFPSLLLFVIGSLPQLKGQDSSIQGIGAASGSVCPDDIDWTGKQTNHSYGFAVTIPQRLTGYWNSTPCSKGPDGCKCMSDHGRIIPLTPEPHEPGRHIEVFATHAGDERTAAQLVDISLASIRQRSREHSVKLRYRSNIVLAGLQAQRAVVRYYDEKLKVWLIDDFIEARRNGIEYSLYLRTKDTSYRNDRIVFDSFVASFVLTGE